MAPVRDFIFEEGREMATGPSEFGGYGGLQQPPPHEPSAAEKLVRRHHYGKPDDADVDPEEEALKDMEAHGYKGEASL